MRIIGNINDKRSGLKIVGNIRNKQPNQVRPPQQPQPNVNNSWQSLVWNTIKGLPQATVDVGSQTIHHPIQTAEAVGSGLLKGLAPIHKFQQWTNPAYLAAKGIDKLAGTQLAKPSEDAWNRLTGYKPPTETGKGIKQGFELAGSNVPYMIGGEIMGATKLARTSPRLAKYLGWAGTSQAISDKKLTDVKGRAGQLALDTAMFGVTGGFKKPKMPEISTATRDIPIFGKTPLHAEASKAIKEGKSFDEWLKGRYGDNKIEIPKIQGIDKKIIKRAIDFDNSEEFVQKFGSDLQEIKKKANIRFPDEIEKWWDINIKPLKSRKQNGSIKLDNLNPTGGIGSSIDYTPHIRAKQKIDITKLTTLDKTSGGNPDDIITIYRGTIPGQKKIVAGDFITDLPELASSYATGGTHIIQKDVRLGDILDDVNDVGGNEYLYRPNADKEIAEAKSQLRKVWEEANNSAKNTLKTAGNTEKQKIQGVIANAEYVKNSIIDKGQEAYLALNKLSKKDLKLLEDYELGTKNLSQKAENPEDFDKALSKLKDYYDYRHSMGKSVGSETPYRQNYIPHQWDLSNPADRAKFNELLKQRGTKQISFANKPRVFNTYAEGEALGFKRKNPNILGDLKNDYKGASYSISNEAIKTGLDKAVPNKISFSGTGATKEGIPFINSNSPGLEGMSMHPDIAKQLKGYEPVASTDIFKLAKNKGGLNAKNILSAAKEAGAGNTFLSVWDHATTPMKQLLWEMSGFHSANIGLNFAGQELTNPEILAKGLKDSTKGFFSEGYTKKVVDSFKKDIIPGSKDSIYDAAMKSGSITARDLPNLTAKEKFNPFKISQKAIFDRQIRLLKLYLAKAKFGDGKISPTSPEGLEIGREITKIAGDINQRMMNTSPNFHKWLSRLFLAPNFTHAKYSLVGDALTKGGISGSMARKQILGKSVAVGIIAELGTLASTGKFPSLKQTLLNFTIAPEIQTNLKTPSGKRMAVGFPHTYMTEASQPIGGLFDFQNNHKGLINYGKARLNPVLSDVIKGVTNKDYFGNTIVNPNKPNVLGQLAQNYGVGHLPIGMQAIIRAKQGKITPLGAAIDIAGLKAKTDYNDPTSKFWDMYRRDKSVWDKYTQGELTPQERMIYKNKHRKQLAQFAVERRIARAYGKIKGGGGAKKANAFLTNVYNKQFKKTPIKHSYGKTNNKLYYYGK